MESFTIPVISDVLDSLGKSKYFSTVHCASGFWQIPIRGEDRPKTAFSTEIGHYDYKSMPFGLTGAPATLQRLMSTVLSGMQGLKCLVYLDIIVYAETKLPLKITDTPDSVWQNCSMDIVGPLTQTYEGNKYLLTFQDELSKYTLAVPIRQQDASTVAKVFVEQIILKFGIPQTLLTDQGSNFLSELFANTCKLLRFNRIKTSSYHPQTELFNERTAF